ncbi:MAG: YceH family protein [Acidimicrobiia bacterium]|nr:YceH family protein [Acidimicrobiia bacterium]NNL70689.1 YceH family protein [Acidimicrobiia bacterium]
MDLDLDELSLRLLGCLIEKQMTTPEYYPLTINALTAAANQKTNRDPVTSFSEAEVLDGINALRERGLVRAVRSPGGRSAKYKHALDDMLEIDTEQASLLAVLMLRGEQTAGELRLRTERYCDFPSVEQVEAVLAGLQTRDEPLTIRLERRPGEKEARHRHLLGNSDAPRPAPATESAPPEDALTKLEARLAALEERVTALESN